MSLNVKRVDVWVMGIRDSKDLSTKLCGLAKAGALLQFVTGRVVPTKPGTGVVFLSPVQGAAQMRAAKGIGLRRSKSIHGVRIEGPDKCGIGAKIMAVLADNKINPSGLTAASIGKRFVSYLALGGAADAAKVIRVLKGI